MLRILEYLIHWGWVMHICISKLTVIGSDNGLSSDRPQAIIWTNAGIVLIQIFGTNFSEILSKIHTFPFKKMHLQNTVCERGTILLWHPCVNSLKLCEAYMHEWTGSSLEYVTWWHHWMETFSALLAICAGNSPVAGEFPAQRPVTQSFDVSFDLCLNKRLSKQSWGWWFETLSCPLWRHCNDVCHHAAP